MGKVLSLLTKPIRTFNIENRARRVIEREKPIRAPEYPAAKKQRDIADSLQPEFMEKHYKKDLQLDKRLKDVFVVSNDTDSTLKKDGEETTTKPLPQTRRHHPEFALGFYESNSVGEGRCTLTQALTFISGHSEDPEKFSIENISTRYKLDPLVVKNILNHFKIPEMSTFADNALIETQKRKEKT